MRSSPLMRVAGSILSPVSGRWTRRTAPQPCRGPPTPHGASFSDTAALATSTAGRVTRTKRQSVSKAATVELPRGAAGSSGVAISDDVAVVTSQPADLATSAGASKRARRTKVSASCSASISKVHNSRSAPDQAMPKAAPSGPDPAAAAAAAVAAAAPAAASTPVATTSTAPKPQLASAVRPTNRAGILLVVDGNYLANRAYFGYGNQGLTTANGVPTSITYSVVRTLHAAIRQLRPSALAVVFDPRGPTFRGALSLLDPAAGGQLGQAAARLAQQGRLDWQDLATRLLHVPCIRADVQAAAAAETAASPASFLQSDGTFLPPPPPAFIPFSGDDPAEAAARVAAAAAAADGGATALDGAAATAAAAPPSSRSAAATAAALQVLAEALGPELAAELGLAGMGQLAGAEAEAAAARLGVELSYKAGRVQHTDTFYTDFHNLQRLLGLMCVPPLMRPWLEADDLAGLLVSAAVQQGMGVRLLSGDRDLMQLVSDPHDVALLYPANRKNGGSGPGSKKAPLSSDFPFVELREADVVAALGVAPGRVADVKALMGDDSDKLPGVKGIGPKTAVQLLESYGSLEGVYGAADKMTPKRRALLKASHPAAQYSLAMARVLGAPGAPPAPPGALSEGLLPRLALRGFTPALVQPALRELGMSSLTRGAAQGGQMWRDFGGAAEA